MKYPLPRPVTAEFFGLICSGDSQYAATSVSSPNTADFSSIVFYSGNDVALLQEMNAGIIIADLKLKDVVQTHRAKAIVYAEKPKFTFLSLLQVFFVNGFEDNPVNPDARGSKISSLSYIESNVAIGKDTIVFPHVAIYNPTVIGSNCRIQSGTVIGSVGLGDLWFNGRYNDFVHLGGVRMEDDVTVGANVNICRGMLEDTVIGAGTRIANNVSIGHSTVIGRNCYISAGVNIGGACVIEDNAWLGVGTTLTDHVRVGTNTMIGTGGVLLRDAMENSLYLGNPARRISERK